MNDLGLCYIASMIVLVYTIYMTVGPGGDGVVFGSVLTAIGIVAGVKFERMRGRAAAYAETEPIECLERS